MKIPLYSRLGLPVLQNKVFGTKEEALNYPTGDMNLVQDGRTGFIHNNTFDPSLVVYDESYQNEQSNSPIFQKHLEQVAGIIHQRMGGGSVMEIGCGKGKFLEMIQERGLDIYGCDPAYQGQNPNIHRCDFSYYCNTYSLQFRGIILRHVLEHVQNPYEFLVKIAEANNWRGKIYIEVPDFDWITKHNAWFDIYYEHVNYFRINDLMKLFKDKHEVGHTFYGQYIYIVAELGSLREPIADDYEVACVVPDFYQRMYSMASDLVHWSRDKNIVIWGAASKGVLFAIIMKQLGVQFQFAVDISEAKQNSYLPVSGLEVISPTQAMQRMVKETIIMVMNSNYMEEVKRRTLDQFIYVPID